jgi:hypothetical protein
MLDAIRRIAGREHPETSQELQVLSRTDAHFRDLMSLLDSPGESHSTWLICAKVLHGIMSNCTSAWSGSDCEAFVAWALTFLTAHTGRLARSPPAITTELSGALAALVSSRISQIPSFSFIVTDLVDRFPPSDPAAFRIALQFLIVLSNSIPQFLALEWDRIAYHYLRQFPQEIGNDDIGAALSLMSRLLDSNPGLAGSNDFEFFMCQALALPLAPLYFECASKVIVKSRDPNSVIDEFLAANQHPDLFTMLSVMLLGAASVDSVAQSSMRIAIAGLEADGFVQHPDALLNVLKSCLGRENNALRELFLRRVVEENHGPDHIPIFFLETVEVSPFIELLLDFWRDDFVRLVANVIEYLTISSETFFQKCEARDEDLVASEIKFALMLRVATAVMKREFSEAIADSFFEFARRILVLLGILAQNGLNRVELALLLFFRIFAGLSADNLIARFGKANLEDRIGVLVDFLFASIDTFDSLTELAINVLAVSAMHESPRFAEYSVVMFPLFFERVQMSSSSSLFCESVILFTSRDADRGSQFISSLLSEFEVDVLDHRTGLLFYLGSMFKYAQDQATFDVFIDLLQPERFERLCGRPHRERIVPLLYFWKNLFCEFDDTEEKKVIESARAMEMSEAVYDNVMEFCTFRVDELGVVAFDLLLEVLLMIVNSDYIKFYMIYAEPKVISLLMTVFRLMEPIKVTSLEAATANVLFQLCSALIDQHMKLLMKAMSGRIGQMIHSVEAGIEMKNSFAFRCLGSFLRYLTNNGRKDSFKVFDTILNGMVATTFIIFVTESSVEWDVLARILADFMSLDNTFSEKFESEIELRASLYAKSELSKILRVMQSHLRDGPRLADDFIQLKQLFGKSPLCMRSATEA